MIDPESIAALRTELATAIQGDRRVLDELRDDVRPLKGQTRRIQPRSTTAISLVGTDGGNNKIEFDPFMVQLVRVVDSSNNEYCLEVVTPTSDRAAVNARHFGDDGTPRTALGQMMAKLLPEGQRTIWNLSPMIPEPVKPGYAHYPATRQHPHGDPQPGRQLVHLSPPLSGRPAQRQGGECTLQR